MGRVTSMIGKMLDTLTGRSIKEAVKENSKTATDLKKDIEEATRAKIEKEALAKIHEEAKAAHAAGGSK